MDLSNDVPQHFVPYPDTAKMKHFLFLALSAFPLSCNNQNTQI